MRHQSALLEVQRLHRDRDKIAEAVVRRLDAHTPKAKDIRKKPNRPQKDQP